MYKLLPHIKEPIYGLKPDTAQVFGWELIEFNIPKLWEISTGKNVTVGVIDTGCDINHKDLKNNIIEGKNFINRKQDPIDDNGHGTHVCGTICAENNSLGMVGIAPDAKIMPLKALDKNGSGSQKNIADAIVYGSKHCDFLCMSLGSKHPSISIHNAIKTAVKNNCIVFCAAGNSGEDEPIMYPARFKETICVGAIDKNLNRTPFTCTGNELDFLSPGHDIFSCDIDNSYALMSGTSMATPFIVGCACLLKSKQSHIDRSTLIETFKKYCVELKDKKYRLKKYQGYGILKINKSCL